MRRKRKRAEQLDAMFITNAYDVGWLSNTCSILVVVIKPVIKRQRFAAMIAWTNKLVLHTATTVSLLFCSSLFSVILPRCVFVSVVVSAGQLIFVAIIEQRNLAKILANFLCTVSPTFFCLFLMIQSAIMRTLYTHTQKIISFSVR